ncbi:hypothetical protein MK079_03430 [Candidatus Gracilibacteria bacterium]|nr:hypothetical protein [Candidatus Gracilibacteria bacterium]
MNSEILVSRINISSKNFIGFQHPFFKVKLGIGNKTYRLIVSYDPEKQVVLCINIFDKKDKNIGQNISWRLHQKDILGWTEKNMQCIRDKQYYTLDV